jgi:Secretion system C-terminal sorting domain
MKKLITLFCLMFLTNIKAQTQQLLTNTAHEFGFVDATKTTFYTYNDIDKNNPNPPANFELKKFNPVTNTFSVVFTMPNNFSYISFKPLSIINGKCLFRAQYNNTSSNLFVYDGIQYDSLFSISVLSSPNLQTYTDVINQKIYFAISGPTGMQGVYSTDGTKLGTNKLCSFNSSNRNDLYGIGSTVYFTEISNSDSKLFKLNANIKTIIDSSFIMNVYKDDLNNELFIYKTYNTNPPYKSLARINSLNQLSALPIPPIYPYDLLGRVGNKLAFIPQTFQGIELYDITNQSINTIYKLGSTTEPNFINIIFPLSLSKSTPSNNHMYICTYGTEKLWVTDGNTVTEINQTAAASVYTFDFSNKFCGENWLAGLQFIINYHIRMFMFYPNGTNSVTCFQSPDPNMNCFYSSAYNVNNKTYILSKSNLYEITNCSISSSINTIQKETVFSIYPNPCTSSFSLQLHEAFQSGTLTIYNSLGKKCLSQTIQNNNSPINVSTNRLATGIYNVMVSDNRYLVVSKKLVVE